MSGIDLSAATAAAYAEVNFRLTPDFEDGIDFMGDAVRIAVVAAAPLIAEEIAQALEAERSHIKGSDAHVEIVDLYDRGRLYGMSVAARIAREVTR